MIGPICPDCRDEFDDDASLTTHLDYWSSRALTYAPGSGPSTTMMMTLMMTDMPHLDLLNLDVIPGRSGVEIDCRDESDEEFDFDQTDRFPARVRFRAFRYRQVLWFKSAPRYSEWSGWFDVTDCPIQLTWAAFDFSQ